jgi:hypothetical protein
MSTLFAQTSIRTLQGIQRGECALYGPTCLEETYS